MTRSLTQGVSCEVCGKQRIPGEIHRGESKLLKGQTLIMCNKCLAEKKEPRWIIIIVARTGKSGLDKVAPYIEERRYEGPEITGKEILKRTV